MDETLNLLEKFESPNVTFIDKSGDWPIVWEQASGCHVYDSSGKGYLDLTSAFGVSVLGHAHPKIVKAGQNQMGKLLHAMGDVHPHQLKAKLCQQLSHCTFERWGKNFPGNPACHGRTILCNSGFEAVEAALKTATLATGKREVLAIEGGYHGLGYGALMATHRDDFRSPFIDQIGGKSHWLPFPDKCSKSEVILDQARKLFSHNQIGAVILEPMQARGGIRIFPKGFLRSLKELADEFGVLMICDEIYTGFCRTGKMFACEYEGFRPDIICLGKALTGGFPLSACVGRHDIMESAWPRSNGEAIHTSTFLGHPVGCAMALEQIQQLHIIGAEKVVSKKGEFLKKILHDTFPDENYHVRGKGLMIGLEVKYDGGSRVWDAVQRSLKSGFIFLPCGAQGNILAWTPPFIINEDQLISSVQIVSDILLEKP